jgi:hypothetical protein
MKRVRFYDATHSGALAVLRRIDRNGFQINRIQAEPARQLQRPRIPRVVAIVTACVRSLAASVAKMLFIGVLTVSSERPLRLDPEALPRLVGITVT